MNLDEFIAEEEARDPEFKAAREALRPSYEFKRALIQARLDAGLTNRELAERLGKKPAAVERLEMGWTPPRLDTLFELARVLDVQFTISPDGSLDAQPARRRAPNGKARRATAAQRDELPARAAPR
jgi:transcriptional regulator with XRE-family HTH domain